MSHIYTYNITNDFPSGAVNAGKFHNEIEASSIATSLLRVETTGGTFDNDVVTGGSIDVVFENPLSAGDKTTLDNDTTNPAGGLIAAHNPTPNIPEINTFDSNIENIEVNTPITTTSKNYTSLSGLTLNTSNTSPANYILFVTVELNIGSSNKTAMFRLTKNGSPIAGSEYTFYSTKGNQTGVVSFHGIIEEASPNTTIAVEMKISGNNTVLTVNYANLTAYRDKTE